MSETRKLAAILVSDVVGYSRLAGADEDRILARLRALRSDLIDPTIAVHHGRIVKRTGDGSIIEFRSVVDAVNCAIEVQRAMVERNAGVAPDKRIEFRDRHPSRRRGRGERRRSDGRRRQYRRAARRDSQARRDLPLRGRLPAGQVAARSSRSRDLGPQNLKNIAEPVRAYSLRQGAPLRTRRNQPIGRERIAQPLGLPARRRAGARRCCGGQLCLAFGVRAAGWASPTPRTSLRAQPRSFDRGAAVRESVGRSEPRLFRRRHHREPHHRPLAHPQHLRHRPQHRLHLQGQERRRQGNRQGARRALLCSKARCSATRVGCASTRS